MEERSKILEQFNQQMETEKTAGEKRVTASVERNLKTAESIIDILRRAVETISTSGNTALNKKSIIEMNQIVNFFSSIFYKKVQPKGQKIGTVLKICHYVKFGCTRQVVQKYCIAIVFSGICWN